MGGWLVGIFMLDGLAHAQGSVRPGWPRPAGLFFVPGVRPISWGQRRIRTLSGARLDRLQPLSNKEAVNNFL